MFNKKIVSISAAMVLSANVYALTIEDAVNEMLTHSPSLKESVHNYKMALYDVKAARSEYFPKLNLSAGIGKEESSDDSRVDEDLGNDIQQASATVSYNLFNGLSSTNNYKSAKSSAEAEYYSLAEKINTSIYDLSEAYLNAMRYHELDMLTGDSLNAHKEIHEKIVKKKDSGFSDRAEFEVSSSRLALAQSNSLVSKNNYLDSLVSFFRKYGKHITENDFVKPNIESSMPETLDDAVSMAFENNPSLLSGTHTVESAKYLYKKSRAAFMPSIDIELKSEWSDNNFDNDTENSVENHSAMIYVTYNFFNGGYDSAIRSKTLESMNKNAENHNDNKLFIQENIMLAWNSINILKDQIEKLKAHSEFANKTLETYKEELNLGRRDLLDILNAENEYVNAKKSIVNAEYDLILAKLRLMHALGNLKDHFGVSMDDLVGKDS